LPKTSKEDAALLERIGDCMVVPVLYQKDSMAEEERKEVKA
jgi:hypothetical protein